MRTKNILVDEECVGPNGDLLLTFNVLHFLSWFFIVCLTDCVSVYLSVCLCEFINSVPSWDLLLSFNVTLSVFIYHCLFDCLLVCLSICLTDCLLVCLSVYMSVCHPVCLSFCLLACLSVCLSVCLSEFMTFAFFEICFCQSMSHTFCLDLSMSVTV